MRGKSMHRSTEVLRQIPFFSGLSDAHRQMLAPVVITARYRKGQILFVEGEPSRALYFIHLGRVKVYRLAVDGREQILHLLGDGEPIAVVPFLDGGPYPATAEVIEDSEIADRKSTRLNSSHVAISYAVFCLKKKHRKHQNHLTIKPS